MRTTRIRLRAGVVGRLSAVAVVAAGLLCAPSGYAQEVNAHAAASPSQALPSPDDTLRAYNRVEGWVRAWMSPKLEGVEARSDVTGKPLAGALGACVSLRWHGELVGRGVAAAFWSAGQGAEDAENLRRLTCARAVGDAMRQADAKLPLPNDLSRADAAKQLTPDILISLELAGPLKPLTAATWDELDASLNPGLDGLAVTTQVAGGEEPGLAGGGTRIKFPSEMMMGNLMPQKALRSMIAGAIGEGGAAAALESPKELREKHGVRMWTFRVSHVAQGAPRGGPVFLYRGARLVGMGEMTVGELRGMAGRLALNLTNRNAVDSNTFDFRTYQPTNATLVGDDATQSAMLFSAAAVSHFQLSVADQSLQSFGMVEKVFSGYFARVREQLAELQTVTDWVFYLMSDSNLHAIEKPYDLRQARAEGVLNEWVESTAVGKPMDSASLGEQCRRIAEGWKLDRLTPVERSMLLYTIARKSDQRHSGSRSLALTRLLRQTAAECPRDQLVSLMPWFGWAEVCEANTGRNPAPTYLGTPLSDEHDPGEDIPSAIALREMRAQCWKHQLGFAEINDDSLDMLGGICFTKSAGTPLPTWQCVRPIAFLATMLGDDRLTEPAERKLETFRLLQALRFLRQLQADESCGWMYPEPEKAIGGIRAAPWDQSMPPDATSLTLMAVCEAIKSLEKLEAAEKAVKPAEVPGAK